MNVAVIGGGGSHGAVTVGMLKKLNKKYDIVIGTSTGALMSPLVALGRYESLSDIYSSTRNKDVYDIMPFNSYGKLKWYRFDRLIRMQSYGKTNKLLQHIKANFTEYDYEELQKRGKEVILCVSNLSSNIIQYISSKDIKSYDVFVQYMWASASIPLVSSWVRANNDLCMDGGIAEVVPLEKAISKNPASIDVFTHRAKKPKGRWRHLTGLFDKIYAVWRLTRKEIEDNDLKKLNSSNNVNVYYMPVELKKSSGLFDPVAMRDWIALGYNDTQNLA